MSGTLKKVDLLEGTTSPLTGKPYSKRWHQIYETRKKLPVWEHKDTINRMLDQNQTIIIVGETGSGKTTQLPQFCLDYCLKQQKKSSDGNSSNKLRVACTQPRRVAAISVATRVSEELDVSLGGQVGYSVRFEACSSSATRLKYLTDGMLLREAMLDGYLTEYSIIILDEAHERTLQTEILFGIIKRALEHRNNPNNDLPTLKVIAMSATINVKIFKRYLDCAVFHIKGRQFPVQDLFAERPQSDLLTSTLITVFQIHRTQNEGDVLVFCSGQDEIQSLITLSKRVLKQAPDDLRQLDVLPLYAALPASYQMKIFEKPKLGPPSQRHGGDSLRKVIHRRVIFATNVAETSVTIPDIKFVIDTGKVKCRKYCPKTAFESLKVTTISKAQASQRSGRAGRTSEGTCYRLYTHEDYTKMMDHIPAEIKRCNMDSVVLQIISIGIKNINNFEFLERPDAPRLAAALRNLLSLSAIKATGPSTKSDSSEILENGHSSDKKTTHLTNGGPSHCSVTDDIILNVDYKLTSTGKKLSLFPLSPQMSRVILAANDLGCLDEALTVVSLLSVESLFYVPPNKQSQADAMLEKFRSNEGDTVMLLKVYKAFRRTSVIDRPGLRQWCAEHFIHAKNLKLARLIRKQLSDLCKSIGWQTSSCGQDTSNVRRALAHGLYNNVATMWNGKYRNKASDDIHIHPNSCLFKVRPESVMYMEIVETNKCYMRNCTLVDMSWIREISSSGTRLN